MPIKIEELQGAISTANYIIHETNIGKFFNDVEVFEGNSIKLKGFNINKPKATKAKRQYIIYHGTSTERFLIEHEKKFLSIKFLDLVRLMNYDFNSFEHIIESRTSPTEIINYEDPII